GEFEYAMEDLKAAIDLDPDGKNPASLRARALAAATAAAIKELIERKEAENKGTGGRPASPPRGDKQPPAQPPPTKKRRAGSSIRENGSRPPTPSMRRASSGHVPEWAPWCRS